MEYQKCFGALVPAHLGCCKYLYHMICSQCAKNETLSKYSLASGKALIVQRYIKHTYSYAHDTNAFLTLLYIPLSLIFFQPDSRSRLWVYPGPQPDSRSCLWVYPEPPRNCWLLWKSIFVKPRLLHLPECVPGFQWSIIKKRSHRAAISVPGHN